jgi:hypothetical protein
MEFNKQLIYQSVVFENSEFPFRFYETNILTDEQRSYFPYTNWFRGDYMSCFPMISDREAGFRPRIVQNQQKNFEIKNNFKYPNHCFRGSIKQSKPCFTDDDDDDVYKVKFDDPTLLDDDDKLFLFN